MASTFKTFANNEILTADDVNDTLNPSTADHIPRAVAAGIASAAVTSGANVDVTVTFPSGRFSAPPVVALTLVGTSAGMINLSVVARSVSATSMQFRVHNTGTLTGSIPVHWHAIQM